MIKRSINRAHLFFKQHVIISNSDAKFLKYYALFNRIYGKEFFRYKVIYNAYHQTPQCMEFTVQ